MNISYFSNSHIPSREANSIHVINMASSFAKMNNNVNLYCHLANQQRYSQELIERQIPEYYGVDCQFKLTPIRHFPFQGSNTLGSMEAVINSKWNKTDLVYGRHGRACAFAAFSGIPTIFETHQPISWFSKIDKKLIHTALNRNLYKYVVTISEPLKEILLRETNYPPEKIIVAHDGAPSVTHLRPMKIGRENRIKVGYCGHLYEGRGIEIIADLANRMTDIDFYLVGGNNDDIVSWKERTKKLDNLHILGFQSPAVAARMRLSFDILLAPYQNNTSLKNGRNTSKWMSPLKIFEYMASSKPFICSDIPVLRDVLENNLNCLLVPPSNVDEWEDSLMKLISNEDLRKRLAKTALKDYQEKYSWDNRAKSIIDMI
ncbi:glycosyltransferase [Thalassospira australica]|uniref:glycosyltransferase n=1 Tax=Thalassospira australica TaxID=1528106 RepID=UPI003850731A